MNKLDYALLHQLYSWGKPLHIYMNIYHNQDIGIPLYLSSAWLLPINSLLFYRSRVRRFPFGKFLGLGNDRLYRVFDWWEISYLQSRARVLAIERFFSHDQMPVWSHSTPCVVGLPCARLDYSDNGITAMEGQGELLGGPELCWASLSSGRIRSCMCAFFFFFFCLTLFSICQLQH